MKTQKNKILNEKFVITATLLFIVNLCYSQFNIRTIIQEGLSIGIEEIITADINNDDFKDIVIVQNKANLEKIGFYINQGDGSYSNYELMLQIDNPFSITSGDYNNDGWIDFVVSAGSPNSIILLLNNMDSTFSTSIIDINNSVIEQVVKLQSVDIDNDNDMDIVAIGDIDLIIYYNNGVESFNKIVIPPGIITEYYDFTINDINNDGFKDIITTGAKIVFYMNTNGIINYDNLRSDSIQNTFNLLSMVEVNDFNNDEFADLIASGGNSNEIYLFFNDGNGFFNSYTLIETNIMQCNSLSSDDLDNDGDIDIFTGFPQTGKVVWYENLGNGTFTSENVIYMGTPPYPTYFITDDLNNDGKIDLIWSEELSVHINSGVTNIENVKEVIFECYPNPSENNLFIRSEADGILLIFNTEGQLLEKISSTKGENNLQLNLTPALYYFQFISGTSTITKKVIIK